MRVPLVSVVSWSPTRFHDALDARGLSANELATMVGVNSSTIRSYRRGATAPSPPVLVRIAAALELPIADLAPASPHPSLHELRWLAGHTVASIAAKVEVTRGQASAILGGRAPLKQTDKWARALGVSEMAVEAATRKVPHRSEVGPRTVADSVSGPPDAWALSVRVASSTLTKPLTPTQLNVLQMLCSDLSTIKMAAELGVTRNTLRTHIRNVYARLGPEVNSRRAARRFVLRAL
ncbi:helix-turn-helix domain-containing protein [Solicola sp. PLA-1-18]|uniref:helix-turn-helix domain-containing protein n=1 Tax=Solicola sp. PLA-1-18 TaxID=3380532 RepID=UPI003B7F94C9